MWRVTDLKKNMPTPREKFQGLLKKLFQFDCAELDFGIYRIMNHKRAVIERFIEKDLLDGVAIELTSGALAEESGLAQQLTEVAAQIKENFGDEALDAEGNLAAQYHQTPRGKQYLELQERTGKAKSRPELEAEIFNHLYSFFSRYYDEGDFMSLRRYSKRDKYAIPYNGEEVHLHWANSDQYYIKTILGERQDGSRSDNIRKGHHSRGLTVWTPASDPHYFFRCVVSNKSLRREQSGSAPRDQDGSGSSAYPMTSRGELFHQNETRQTCYPAQVHDAPHKKQQHKHPAATQAIHAMLNAHNERTTRPLAPMGHHEVQRRATAPKAGLL